MAVKHIRARGYFVEITSDENGARLIQRKDAIIRARALNNMRAEDPEAGDLCEAFLQAASEAYVNEHGREPAWKKDMMLLVNAKSAEMKARKFGRL